MLSLAADAGRARGSDADWCNYPNCNALWRAKCFCVLREVATQSGLPARTKLLVRCALFSSPAMFIIDVIIESATRGPQVHFETRRNCVVV